MQYWLLKSEPKTYSMDDLVAAPSQSTTWEGVRNYQARNYLRDEMKVGDLAFFYHSSCEVPAIVGIVRVVETKLPDLCALDKDSDYYDPKSTKEAPRWYMVRVAFVEKLQKEIPLKALKAEPKLQQCLLLRPGNRLSVIPLTKQEWQVMQTL